MALALVGGAAIGALFGALYDVVKESMGRTVLQYKPLLGDLKFTLDSLRPRIVQQIGDHNMELGLPNDDIESLQRQMEEGIMLVRKLSNIGMWNCYVWCSCCNSTKPSYSDQLVELDRSLRILLEILKLQEARDVKEVLLLARKIHDKQDDLERRMSDLLKVQQEAGDVGGSSGSNTGTTIQQGNEGNGGHQVAPLGGVGGAAALGAVFGVLFDTVAQVKDKTMMLKRPLGDIKSTLDSLKPLIEEMAEYNKVLNLPNKELENVISQMEKGVKLLHKCLKVHRWTSYKRHEYANKLLGLHESLQGLLNILRQQLARDVRESLVSVSNIEKVINQIEGIGTVQLQNDPTEIEDPCEVLEPPQPEVGLSLQGTRYVKETLDSAAKIEVGVKRIEGSVDVQGQTYMGIAEPTLPTVEAPDAENEVTEYVLPTVTVGLDVLLRELKRELLKDEVSALVLTGPRGCGKTTLAKNFCQDEEVKNIFKNSIFFVRVSERPNLSLIVRKLYQQIEHKGSLIPELQEDTIALKWLQVFLKETGQHPSLLVLDDVWPGSEPILDKFDKFKTSNYKILVTSRSEFPTFGSPYYLLSLNDEGQMTLSHHSRAYSLESLDDEDLVCVSSAPSFTAMDDDPTPYFRDFSTSYLEDRISHVSEDANPMAHFHDSSASTAGDRSSYVSKDVGTKFPLGSPVKSTQTNMPRKLGAKVNAGDKIMKKVMKAVHGIQELNSEMKCLRPFKDKSKSKKQGAQSAPELRNQSKSSNLIFDRATKSSSSLPSPRSIPELYKEKEQNLRVFSYRELREATNGFSRLLKLGEGDFGSVYKGRISPENGQGSPIVVAIKKLNPRSLQGHKEWLTEVQFLGVVNHPNVVKLLGYCSVDGESGMQRLLVYEYMPNRSFDDHLFNRALPTMPWMTRLQVMLGSAQGLAYLHQGLEVQVIYRDFKSSKVLLDEQFRAKLSGFGLARKGPTGDRIHVSTSVSGGVVGTYGYAAPEYIERGHLSTHSDLWSFGVVLYEILTGRRVLDRNRPPAEQKLLYWVKQFPADGKRFSMIIDPSLRDQYSLTAARKLAKLADSCLNKNAKDRPTMSQVVEVLQQALQDSEAGTSSVNKSFEASAVMDSGSEPRRVIV